MKGKVAVRSSSQALSQRRDGRQVIAKDPGDVVHIKLPADPVRALRALGIPCPGEDGERQTGQRLEGRAFAVLTLFAVISYVAIVGGCLLQLIRGGA